jgi:hypothetical protein
MASTRNRNTPGNYKAEQWSLAQNRMHQSYLHASNGQAITTHFAGNGLVGGWIPRTELAHNAIDIESELRGIGTTNLVNKYEKVVPEFKTVQFKPFFRHVPLIMPKPLVIENNQRPYPIPK